MVVSAIPVVAGGLYNGMKALYGIGSDINKFMDSHIDDMKASTTASVARSGEVLESVKVGFGIGYVAPAVVIAAGQVMLGNPMWAIAKGAVALLPTNPAAMTCAAVGAILWGWGALNKKEKEELLRTVSEGLNVGIEFVRAVIRFVVDKSQELFGEKNMAALSKQVNAAHKQVKAIVGSIVDTLGKQASGASNAAGETFGIAAETAGNYWAKLKSAIPTKA